MQEDIRRLKSKIAAANKAGKSKQTVGKLQYKLNQLTKNSKGSVVRSKNGIVKSAAGPVRTTDTSPKKMRTVTKLKTPLADRGPSSGTGTVKKVVKSKNYSSAGYNRPVSTSVKKVTPKKVTPKNASSTAIPFGKAFADARSAGKKVFTWKGKSFTTNLKSEKPTTVDKVKQSSSSDKTPVVTNKIMSARGNPSSSTGSVVKKLNDKKKVVDTAPVVTKKLNSARGNQSGGSSTVTPIDRKNKIKKTVVENKLVGIKNNPAYAARLKQGELARMKAKQKSDGEDAKAYAKKLAAKKVADKKAADKKAADNKAADKRRADFIARKKEADKKAADKKAADKKAADKKAAAKKLAAETYWNNTQGKVRTRQAARNKKLKESK